MAEVHRLQTRHDDADDMNFELSQIRGRQFDICSPMTFCCKFGCTALEILRWVSSGPVLQLVKPLLLTSQPQECKLISKIQLTHKSAMIIERVHILIAVEATPGRLCQKSGGLRGSSLAQLKQRFEQCHIRIGLTAKADYIRRACRIVFE